MISNEFLASEILGHGAYLCVRRSGNGDVRRAGAARISTLAERLQLRNEFDPGTPPSRDSAARVRVLSGVVRPKNYTGAAMNNWAYANQVTQQPGGAMPNAFLFPLSK